MTLKYESEILFDLMKRDGDDNPSDVLPYESELKEKYLQQVEGAYPKLQDYRSEWLNYNLNAHLPADFPVESVSNVTNATFENVVPYAYGSAILTGQTLVNKIPNPTSRSYETDIKVVFAWNSDFLFGSYHCYNVANWSREITVISTTGKPITVEWLTDNGSTVEWGGVLSSNIINKKLTLPSNCTSISISGLKSNGWSLDDAQQANVVVLDGHHTIENIPYFEGMQSVKMPVLTTVGKNLFDGKLEYGLIGGENGLLYDSTTFVRSQNFIPINCEKVTYTIFNEQCGLALYFYDANKQFISHLSITTTSSTETVPSNAKFMKIRTYKISSDPTSVTTNLQTQIQIEEGSITTSYEPYKSNILTVNEDVTLRGIGDVEDELNLLTGEVTERIGEIVLDGTESWIIHSNTHEESVIFKLPLSAQQTSLCLTDKFNTIIGTVAFVNGVEAMKLDPSGLSVYINILKSRLSSTDVNGLKQWLHSNPVTLQYPLATESVKTVDLTVTDQDGNTTSIIRPIEGTMHVSTTSQTLPPLLDMSVPVEATSQNLMSFANILEEE